MNRAQPAMTRRESVHGGSTPASMRVMVITNCARLTSLAVNEAAVNVIKLLKDMLNTLNLVPLGTAAIRNIKLLTSTLIMRTCFCRSVSSRDAAVELTGMYLQRDLQ